MSKLIIVGPASPLRGGIADFNEALADELVTQGHQLEIISFSLILIGTVGIYFLNKRKVTHQHKQIKV